MRNTPPTPRRVRSAQESRSATVRAAAAAPSRRQQSKWRREQRQEHTLYIAVGVMVALVLAIFAGGFFYDNVLRANEVVAQIGPDNVTAAQLVDEIRPILRSLEAQSKQLGGAASASRYLEQQKRGLPDQTLNDLIDRYLIAQEAGRRGISVTPAELDEKQGQTVADFQASANPSPTPEPTSAPAAEAEAAVPAEVTAVPTLAAPGTPTPVPTLEGAAYSSALQQLLDRNNMTEADFRKRLQESMLRERLQTAMSQDQVTATQEQVHARHILVDTPEQANDVLAQLQGGADFADLARQVSNDPGSKDKGGDLGWFGRGVMDPPFEQAAFALEAGQLSDVVHGAYGYHIIQTLERGTREVAESQLASQRQKAFSDWLGTRRSSQDVKLQLSQGERDWVFGRIGIRP